MELSTEEKIIQAAIQMVKSHGYKGATTKKIAEEAGVNEVTLFRHFGSKKGLIESIINKFSFIDFISQTLEKEIVWDLEKDLRMLSSLYLNEMEKKRDIILISIKEADAFPELDKMMAKVPIQYKLLLMNYFQKMMQRGHIKNINAEVAATNFFFLNFGYTLLKTRLNEDGTVMPIEHFLDQNIALFIESLR